MGKNNGIIIYDLDIYSNRISFFYDSRERIGSLFGLILTLINILASLIIFGVYLFEIFQRKDLKVYDSNKFSDNTPFININSSNLYFAFGLEDRNSSNRFVDPSIYYPEALFLERVKKEGGEFETTLRQELKFGRCNIENFGENYRQVFGNIEINNSYCLDDFNLTLAGGYKYDKMSYISIKIAPCVNKTERDVICKPKEVIDEYLTGTYLSFILKDIGLNPTNYSIPILPTIQNLYTTVDKRIFRDFIINYGITEIHTDTGFINENINKEKHLQFINSQQTFYFRDEEEYNQGKIFCTIQIRLSDIIHIQKRVYKKVQEIIYLIGGYNQLLYTVFSLISILCNLDLEVKILNKLFNFNLKTNKMTIKINNIKDFSSIKNKNLMKHHYTTKKFRFHNMKNQNQNNSNDYKSCHLSNTKNNLVGIDQNNRNILPIINIVNYNKIDDAADNSKKIITNNISVNQSKRASFHFQYGHDKKNEMKVRAKSLKANERIYFRPFRIFSNSFHIYKKNEENDKENNNIHINLINYYCCGNISRKKKEIELFDLGVSLYRKRMDIINVFTILLLSEKMLLKMDRQQKFIFTKEFLETPQVLNKK